MNKAIPGQDKDLLLPLAYEENHKECNKQILFVTMLLKCYKIKS